MTEPYGAVTMWAMTTGSPQWSTSPRALHDVAMWAVTLYICGPAECQLMCNFRAHAAWSSATWARIEELKAAAASNACIYMRSLAGPSHVQAIVRSAHIYIYICCSELVIYCILWNFQLPQVEQA